MTPVEDGRASALRGLEQEIGTLLRRIRRALSDRAVRVHPELNPTSYLLVSTLARTGGCRAADLAEQFALDKGSVSRLVHQLVELGLVARTPDPADGRASILSVTDDAVHRLAAVSEHGRADVDDRLADWELTDIEQLSAGLARLNHALGDDAAREPVAAGP
jgi:DNA-binding MarR family transcriptional regulator